MSALIISVPRSFQSQLSSVVSRAAKQKLLQLFGSIKFWSRTNKKLGYPSMLFPQSPPVTESGSRRFSSAKSHKSRLHCQRGTGKETAQGRQLPPRVFTKRATDCSLFVLHQLFPLDRSAISKYVYGVCVCLCVCVRACMCLFVCVCVYVRA